MFLINSLFFFFLGLTAGLKVHVANCSPHCFFLGLFLGDPFCIFPFELFFPWFVSWRPVLHLPVCIEKPHQSIGVEASLDQLWRWGIRSLRVDKVDAADDPSAVGAAAADAAATFTPGQPTNPEHFVSPPPRTGGARRVLAFGQDASQQDLGEPDDDDSSDDRADEIDPEAAAAAAAVADEALGIEADVTQGHWLDEDLKSGSGSPRGEAGASAVAHPDWQYFVKLSYGTTVCPFGGGTCFVSPPDA